MEDVSEKASYITFESQSVWYLMSSNLGIPQNTPKRWFFLKKTSLKAIMGCFSIPDTNHPFMKDTARWVVISFPILCVSVEVETPSKRKSESWPKDAWLEKSSGLRIDFVVSCWLFPLKPQIPRPTCRQGVWDSNFEVGREKAFVIWCFFFAEQRCLKSLSSIINIRIIHKLVSLLGTERTHPPFKGSFESMIFLFPKVGYVMVFLEGTIGRSCCVTSPSKGRKWCQMDFVPTFQIYWIMVNSNSSMATTKVFFSLWKEKNLKLNHHSLGWNSGYKQFSSGWRIHGILRSWFRANLGILGIVD